MARFSKALRERIVRDFTARHNGRFDPAVFVEEVREAGPSHEAHEWFEWNDVEAAHQYRVEQARAFVQGIRVSFTVEEVSRGRVTVQERSFPLALSPLGDRRSGGGYIVTDPDDPDCMAELCSQAARDLEAWLGRYSVALVYAGVSVPAIERHVGVLKSSASGRVVAQAA